MKKTVRLTESDLNSIIGNSVKKVLREYQDIFFDGKKKVNLPYADEWGGRKDDDDFNDEEGDRLIGLHCSRNNRRKPMLKEAENGGWVVDSMEARDAYELAEREMGKDVIDSAIIRSLSDEQLAQCLAYIFRMYNFRAWEEYQDNVE